MATQRTAAPRGAETLALGFGTSVAMWFVGYLCRMPPAVVPSWLLALLLLACLVGGGFVAGRLGARGWRSGLAAGLLSSVVNLLVLGSLLGGGAGEPARALGAVVGPGLAAARRRDGERRGGGGGRDPRRTGSTRELDRGACRRCRVGHLAAAARGRSGHQRRGGPFRRGLAEFVRLQHVSLPALADDGRRLLRARPPPVRKPGRVDHRRVRGAPARGRAADVGQAARTGGGGRRDRAGHSRRPARDRRLHALDLAVGDGAIVHAGGRPRRAGAGVLRLDGRARGRHLDGVGLRRRGRCRTRTLAHCRRSARCSSAPSWCRSCSARSSASSRAAWTPTSGSRSWCWPWH